MHRQRRNEALSGAGSMAAVGNWSALSNGDSVSAPGIVTIVKCTPRVFFLEKLEKCIVR